jgi:hypothetical protein
MITSIGGTDALGLPKSDPARRRDLAADLEK